MILLLLLLCVNSFAAISATAVWQVQTVSSSDTNGGCFVDADKGATGVDHSQSGGHTFTSTLSAVSTTTLTDSANGFSNTMLGDCIFVAGAIGLTYEIKTFTDSGHVVVDRALGTFSTTSGQEGNPVLTLGHVCKHATNGNIAFFKNDGTFSITSNTNVVDGGMCQVGNAVALLFDGYTTNRTLYNTDTPPTLQINASTVAIVNGQSTSFFNFTIDCNSQTASRIGGSGNFVQTTVKNCTAAITGTQLFFNVLFTGNSAVVVTGTSTLCFYCEAYANTVTPFQMNSTGNACVFCLSYANTGATTDGFSMSAATQQACLFCTAYNNGRDGFRAISNGPVYLFANSYAEGNAAGGATGFNIGGTNSSKFILGFGYFGNTTNITTPTTTVMTTAITPASSAFVSSTNLNTNATANAGALLRSVALPATFLRGLTATYLDVNGARHQDPTLPALSVTVGTPTVQ